MGDKMVERYIRFRPEHEDEFRTVKIVTPTLGYSRGITLHIGLRRVEMTHPGPAHADGDTLVFLPDDGVLFAGDLLFTVTFFAVLPETDTRNWVEALKELDNMSVNRVVPGHGPMSTAHARKRLRDYLQHVQGEGRRFLNKGMSKEETSKAVSAGSGEGWDKLECHAMGVGHVYEELFRSA